MTGNEITSVDLGYGFTKYRRGCISGKFSSVVGETKPIFEESMKDKDLTYNSSFFIGDLAIRHSDIRYATTKDEKWSVWTTRVLLETALALSGSDGKTNLVTGLPVDFYFSQKEPFKELIQRMGEDLEPIRVIEGNDKLIHEVTPRIENIKILPQPLGSAMDYLLDDQGNIKDMDVAKQDILVIDLGRHTLDLLPLHAMEIGKQASSPPGLGVGGAYKALATELKTRIGKCPASFEMDNIVLKGRYQGYDIEPLIDYSFKQLGNQIQLSIESLNTHFDLYLLTGGAANRLVPHLELKNKVLVPNAQMANVNGYRKVGMRVWQKQ